MARKKLSKAERLERIRQREISRWVRWCDHEARARCQNRFTPLWLLESWAVAIVNGRVWRRELARVRGELRRANQAVHRLQATVYGKREGDPGVVVAYTEPNHFTAAPVDREGYVTGDLDGD